VLVAASVWTVRDWLWQVFRELPPHREPGATGRSRVPERTAFNAVVYVLVTGVAWRHRSPRSRSAARSLPV
jgi:transposase